jgi:hypothetical protein
MILSVEYWDGTVSVFVMCLGNYTISDIMMKSTWIAVSVFDFGLSVGIYWYNRVLIGFILLMDENIEFEV